MKHCKVTQKAFSEAVWNDKVQNDERLDNGTTNVDTLDAQEYTTENYAKQLLEVRL